jgi:soluble lytic murein transglycosylase
MKHRWVWIVLALVAIDGVLGGWWWWHWRREHRYDAAILAAARRYGLAPALVKAVVWRESAFDARAFGRAEEHGLMQIREDAAREWVDAERVATFQLEHLFNPETNTLAGTWYLRKLLRRYDRTDNPLPYALADYNAGRGRVLQWNQGAAVTNSRAFIAQIGFPGTQQYVHAVMQRQLHYQPQFAKDSP